MVTKNAAKPTVAAAKSKTRKVERKAMPAKSAARSTSAKKSPTSRKTATGKRTKTTSPAVETVAAAEPAKNATHVNAKLSTARAPARAASRNGGVVATGVVTRPAQNNDTQRWITNFGG